jgi:hypothetical protein
MKSPTSTPTTAPTVTVTEQWAVIYDGRVDLALVFGTEESVREYIRKGVEEYGQDAARYGTAIRHQVLTTTSWQPVLS